MDHLTNLLRELAHHLPINKHLKYYNNNNKLTYQEHRKNLNISFKFYGLAKSLIGTKTPPPPLLGPP